VSWKEIQVDESKVEAIKSGQSQPPS